MKAPSVPIPFHQLLRIVAIVDSSRQTQTRSPFPLRSIRPEDSRLADTDILLGPIHKKDHKKGHRSLAGSLFDNDHILAFDDFRLNLLLLSRL